jgi:aminobenzoyl-glutamate utilization protein B
MRTVKARRATALSVIFSPFWVFSVGHAASGDVPDSHAQLLKLVDQSAPSYIETSRRIWEHPELGYHEFASSEALQEALRKDGFAVTSPVADEPTGFVATYGEGKPVIGILGEFDALPGLSQDTVPQRKALTEGGPGHACGHNLLGSGAALAAVALREFMVKNHLKGTLRYYGTPAEEGGDGKVYMLRRHVGHCLG